MHECEKLIAADVTSAYLVVRVVVEHGGVASCPRVQARIKSITTFGDVARPPDDSLLQPVAMTVSLGTECKGSDGKYSLHKLLFYFFDFNPAKSLPFYSVKFFIDFLTALNKLTLFLIK